MLIAITLHRFIAASAFAFVASSALAQQTAIPQAEARGGLFGFGTGIAGVIGRTSKPTLVEEVKSGSARLERLTYKQAGVKVVVVKSPATEAALPVEVEFLSAQAIRGISKRLSELKKSAVIANFGQPEAQSDSTFRYRGPAESCPEHVELRFQGEMLDSIKWSFCAE
jgi:hypothetical protein